MVLPKDDRMKTETLKTELSLYISVCYFFLLRGIVLTILLPLWIDYKTAPFVHLRNYKNDLSVFYYIVCGLKLSRLVLSRRL